jgi:hypothetical protein
LYFLGEEEVLTGNQYIHLKGVNNDYLSASYKQYLGLKYIYENYKTRFVMCIGTDTFLNIPKLSTYLEGFNKDNMLYIGGHGDNRYIEGKSIYFHSGGSGFILSHKCLELIYPRLENFMEKWIEICKYSPYDNFVASCDVGIAYLLNNFQSQYIICICNNNFINCNYLGIPCHINKIDFKNIISCHNMSLNDFDNYYEILKLNNYFII